MNCRNQWDTGQHLLDKPRAHKTNPNTRALSSYRHSCSHSCTWMEVDVPSVPMTMDFKGSKSLPMRLENYHHRVYDYSNTCSTLFTKLEKNTKSLTQYCNWRPIDSSIVQSTTILRSWQSVKTYLSHPMTRRTVLSIIYVVSVVISYQQLQTR